MTKKLTKKEEALIEAIVTTLAAAARPDASPIHRLASLADLRKLAEGAIAGPIGQRLASAAHKKGHSWTEIAKAVGVSKQWAWFRWAKKEPSDKAA